jgi:hypothetical protein
VVPGGKPHTKFLSSLNNYCKNNDAKLLLIPSVPIYKEDDIHQDIKDNYQILEEDKLLNNNIHISLMPINYEKIDPITGLERQTQEHGSVIYASPKQRLKSIPSPRIDVPRVAMTPGACTHPNSTRRTLKSIIAKMDHVYGAIIVEVQSSDTYHFRQIQAASDGSFCDLGVKYSSEGKPVKVGVEAITPGDYHCGYTDPKVKKAIEEICAELKPKYLILHDFFDGISVNHHIEHNLLERAMLKEKASLERELELTAKELKDIQDYAENIIIVKSNHDELLDQWLTQGKFINERENLIIGLELAMAKAKGEDALEHGLRKYAKLKKQVRFLKGDESFKLTPKKIECGVHGHRGPNGSKGAIAGLERSYGKITYGHSHTPEILRGAFVVGTSSFLKLSYNKGPSSWLQTLCITNKDGSRQLINVINGKWRG